MLLELMVRKTGDATRPRIEITSFKTKEGLVKQSRAGRAAPETIALRFLDQSGKELGRAFAASPIVQVMEQVDTGGHFERRRIESDSGTVAVIAPYNAQMFKVRFEYFDSVMTIHQLETQVLQPRHSDD